MKNMKQALRRHHATRLKKKRSTYWGNHAGSSEKALGQCLSTPCLCSCWMCGHQRKHFGLTIQEQKNLQSMSE